MSDEIGCTFVMARTKTRVITCGYSMLPVMDAPDEMVAKPAHEHALPEGYFMGASGDTLPFFDQEGRAIVLRFWPDGTVTWQLRGRGGEVLEPEPAP